MKCEVIREWKEEKYLTGGNAEEVANYFNWMEQWLVCFVVDDGLIIKILVFRKHKICVATRDFFDKTKWGMCKKTMIHVVYNQIFGKWVFVCHSILIRGRSLAFSTNWWDNKSKQNLHHITLHLELQKCRKVGFISWVQGGKSIIEYFSF